MLAPQIYLYGTREHQIQAISNGLNNRGCEVQRFTSIGELMEGAVHSPNALVIQNGTDIPSLRHLEDNTNDVPLVLLVESDNPLLVSQESMSGATRVYPLDENDDVPSEVIDTIAREASPFPDEHDEEMGSVHAGKVGWDELSDGNLRLQFIIRILGIDALFIFEAKSSDAISLKATVRNPFLDEESDDRLKILSEAVSSVSAQKWQDLLTTRCVQLFGNASMNDNSIQRFMGGTWENHSAVAGRMGRIHENELIYFAVWQHNWYEATTKLNIIARATHQTLADIISQASTESNDEIDQIVDGQLQYMTYAEEKVLYPLIHPLTWFYDASSKQLFVEGFGPVVIGKGEGPAVALANFLRNVHVQFQRLCRTNSFQRNWRQDVMWKLLCRYIDVPEYRLSQPLWRRRVGRLVSTPRTGPWVVEWEAYDSDGELARDKIPLEEFPELAVLRLEQRFIADVAYDRRTDKFRAIKECSVLKTKPPTDQETEQLIEELYEGRP